MGDSSRRTKRRQGREQVDCDCLAEARAAQRGGQEALAAELRRAHKAGTGHVWRDDTGGADDA